MNNPNVISLVQLLEEAYHKQAWHGTNLRGSIRGLSLEQVCWRPLSQRHNIWEVMIHCAYWKYTVRRRLTGEKRGSFPLKGSNWFKRPDEKTEFAWKSDVRLLEETHYHLVETVKGLSPADLGKRTATKKYTHLQTIQGIALHDIYHAGQIQLLKRLQK
ncbi:MAG: DinB family protein [Ignavibacteriales bacterium]|nr:DinB family protein [Ignavibacteriales bacterium]